MTHGRHSSKQKYNFKVFSLLYFFLLTRKYSTFLSHVIRVSCGTDEKWVVLWWWRRW